MFNYFSSACRVEIYLLYLGFDVYVISAEVHLFFSKYFQSDSEINVIVNMVV